MAGSKHSGRPTNLALFPEVAAKLVELVSKGTAMRFAADLCGIPQSVLSAWLVKGNAPGGKKIYREFAAAIKEARRSFVLHHLNNIERHSRQSWQCSAWSLERSIPSEFASAEVKLRIRLEEVEQTLANIQQLAIDRGILEGGTNNALPQE